MTKKRIVKTTKISLLLTVAVAILIGAFASAPLSDNKGQVTAAGINRLDGVLHGDMTEYMNSSVIYKLPAAAAESSELSVILTVDTKPIMDAYEDSDKAVDFAEYAVSGKEAAGIRSEIAAKKARLLADLDKAGVGYTTGEDYNTVLSGFELVIDPDDFKKLCTTVKDSCKVIVGEVFNPSDAKLVENTVNVFDTGIFNSSDVSYDGSGMVVAVLDTGLDSNHTAFSVDNFSSKTLGLTYEQVKGLVAGTTAAKLYEGLSANDVYINEKVPFGFDYADSDPDVYSTHNNHGTHVSGVIVGNDDTIRGVAPNAQLVSMKIFSDVMDTARTSWIIAALEDCAVLGVDVINMSLGTSCGFSRESDEEAVNGVYDKLRAAGISIIAAASNSYSSSYGSESNGNLGLTSNPDTGTVGSPSTYDGVMSVASIKGVETPYLKFDGSIIYFDEATNGASEEKNFFETLLGDKKEATYEFVTIPGIGRSADYTGIDIKGKIALVRRGDNTFEEKAFIAQEKGAAGIIIYNNVSGDIKMNVGDATLAVCSVSQSDGEKMAASGSGKLTINVKQTSGPFISDFSSWGPSPSLQIKPEITAHGGDILSAVTGGGYDRLSGTSMACPNLAGVVILLRQYVVENFKDISGDNVAVSAMVNRLMMSTADIALNTNGLPYAVRKQGAGLANLYNSVNTPGYLTTYDEDGKAMDKTKLELGDDPKKTGVYTMEFEINNIGKDSLSYEIGSYVMTEGVSENKTNSGKTTVTEEAYILKGAKLTVDEVKDGKLSGKTITVAAGKKAHVTLTLTLSDKDKKYLDASFENGMYVEGYITLKAKKGTDISLSVPYLAFYGDWTVAPLFDLDYYATNADELDDGIDPEDKTMADAYATRPVGGVYDDYVSFLGSYYFIQDPEDIPIPANRDYISLTNQVGSIHSLRYVWAGLLRNAAKIDVTITDDATGEVIFECTDEDVRKSYGDGAAPNPANVEIEFDTIDYNLKNNSRYTVKLVGYVDYGDGGLTTNKSNVFEFPLTIDFEAPAVTDVEFYYEYDKTEKKNRLYAKCGIYDNHYAMSSQLGYVTETTDEDGNPATMVSAFEQYLTPVYSKFNDTTYVTYELTDYIYELKNKGVNKNTFVLTCYDYALNFASYEINLPDDYTDFYFENLDGQLTLSTNEVYTLAPVVYPTLAWSEILEYSSSKPSVARVVNNKLVGVSKGNATIKARDPKTNKSVSFTVKVLGEGDEGYVRYDKPVADIFRLNGYKTLKAYYILDNNDKEIGDTGDTRFFEGKYSLTMYPSEALQLNYTLDAFFPRDTKVVFESGNENIVTIDDTGTLTAKAEGFSSVTVKVMMDGKNTYYSQTVNIEVKDPYITNGGQLTHYYGNGGSVVVPADLSLTQIGSFAFSNFDYILKSEEELVEDDRETSKMWYIGDNTITKVVLPEGIEIINSYAFANLTALEEVVLPSTLESIEYGAFFGCTSLQKISFSGDNNLKIINQQAFENCDLRGTLELPSICIVSDYAFAGNQKLKSVKLGDSLLSVGQYAFAGCKALSDLEIKSTFVKYGPYAFTGCESIKEFYVNGAVLPEGMFYECEALKTVTIGPDVLDIGQFAFRTTKIDSFKLDKGNKAFKIVKNNIITTADGKTLIAVAPTVEGEFTQAMAGDSVTTIGKGAFSHNEVLTAINMPKVTVVKEYGVASAYGITKVTLGKLSQVGEYGFFETPITALPTFTKDTKVGKYAFAATAITEVRVPDGMTVEEGVFAECMSLETVVVGNNVNLGKYAFNLSKDYAFEVKSYDREDGERLFYYEFFSPISSITIGDNAVIGENAFANAAEVESVTLGKGAKIGYMAFYNCVALKDIDLSAALEIGDYAFSGDVYYVCVDDSMAIPAVSTEGKYIYTHHGPAIEKLDLSSATSIGENAFSYCRELKEVVLGDGITAIPNYAFGGNIALTTINLDKIVTIGEYAFTETALTGANLAAVESVGDFAFTYCYDLTDLSLNSKGCDIGEGTFSYCSALMEVKNLKAAKNIGDYAFAHTAVVSADLSGAVSLGDAVFLKEELTPFTVVLGDKLTSVGDNPFAMCLVEPFAKKGSEEFNGTKFETANTTYDISDSVFVIDGSLYAKTVNGLELCTYGGGENAVVADGTVRITALAFAGSDVKTVKLPGTVKSIGHKAFYACDSLEVVVFGSYDAPVLEEEFDPAYYECFEHVPGSGDYGSYTDFEGNEVNVQGTGMIPYYMWNATDSMYSNVYYGANFIDYVGYVENKPIMVRPVNGKNYSTFITSYYFDLVIDGSAAPDSLTVDAINAINALPERVELKDKAAIEAARVAYDKIATLEQQSLVVNYKKLTDAEQRIKALSSAETEQAPVEKPTDDNKEEKKSILPLCLGIGTTLTIFLGAIVVAIVDKKKKKATKE